MILYHAIHAIKARSSISLVAITKNKKQHGDLYSGRAQLEPTLASTIIQV
jgi:hypothetical protein